MRFLNEDRIVAQRVRWRRRHIERSAGCRYWHVGNRSKRPLRHSLQGINDLVPIEVDLPRPLYGTIAVPLHPGWCCAAR